MSHEYKELELPNLLSGKTSTKLKILFEVPGILALEKPSGVLIDAYPWYPDFPSIIYSLKQKKALGGLPEYPFESNYGIFALEPAMSGIALIATNKESSNYLRNLFGSYKMLFRFVFLAKSKSDKQSLICELPIAKHYRENKVLVSNKTGKKSKTLFNLIDKLGDYQLWEARTDYLRMHQIRLHAMESGIPILGDRLYNISDQKEDQVGNRRFEPILLHLRSIEWGTDNEKVQIFSPMPDSFSSSALNK